MTSSDAVAVASRSTRRTQVALSLGIAFAIVVAAWFVGGRQGFDEIGRGGQNQSLLPKVGDPAPDFAAFDMEGNVVTLSDYKGKPVWVNFWGAWCPPCRAEMPDIQTAYEQLAPEGLVLLAVSLREPPEDAANFAALNHATFTILSDQYEVGTSNYGIANFPTHLFIDATGTIRAIVLADMDVETAVKHGREIIDSTAG